MDHITRTYIEIRIGQNVAMITTMIPAFLEDIILRHGYNPPGDGGGGSIRGGKEGQTKYDKSHWIQDSHILRTKSSVLDEALMRHYEGSIEYKYNGGGVEVQYLE